MSGRDYVSGAYIELGLTWFRIRTLSLQSWNYANYSFAQRHSLYLMLVRATTIEQG